MKKIDNGLCPRWQAICIEVFHHKTAYIEKYYDLSEEQRQLLTVDQKEAMMSVREIDWRANMRRIKAEHYSNCTHVHCQEEK